MTTIVPDRIKRIVRGEVEATADDIFDIIELRNRLGRERSMNVDIIVEGKIYFLLEELERVTKTFLAIHPLETV